MDRRGFLKSIGKVVGGLVLAPSVVAVLPEKADVIPPLGSSECSCPDLREAGVDEIRVVWADFYDRFLYSLEGKDITDYVWASKQGWSWSPGYKERAIEMLSGKIPSIYQELPNKVKGVQYRIYELTLYPSHLSNLYVSNLINHLYVFGNGAVIRVEILKEWLKNKPLTAIEIINRCLDKVNFPRESIRA